MAIPTPVIAHAAELSAYELELLDGAIIPNGTAHDLSTLLYIVWQGRDGIEFGPVRFAGTNNLGKYWEASPFPGAWTMVHLDRILAVRHPHALIPRADRKA
jgi:hypothetical protein